MQTWSLRADARIPNTDDELHCTQATLIMAWYLLSGERLSMPEAESATGFRSDVETWPYTMIAWLAEHGSHVTHIDAVSPEALVRRPRATLQAAGTDEETIEYFLRISDFDYEAAQVHRALSTGRVRFEVRKPTFDDIVLGIREGALPLVSLDLGTLNDARGGFQGHILIATGAHPAARTVILQDPGPPPRWDWTLGADIVEEAMRYPAESSGTITHVRPPDQS